MTKSQRQWIEKIGLAGEISKDRLQPDTFRALMAFGYITVETSGFFTRVSLTESGKEFRAKQKLDK